MKIAHTFQKVVENYHLFQKRASNRALESEKDTTVLLKLQSGRNQAPLLSGMLQNQAPTPFLVDKLHKVIEIRAQFRKTWSKNEHD